MIWRRALLPAAAAVLAAGCGALGFPEARAPLTLFHIADCGKPLAAARPLSAEVYSALMP